MLLLKTVLAEAGISQKTLADDLKVSPAMIAQLVNHNQWPKSLDELDLQESILRFLAAHGIEADIDTLFKEVAPERVNAPEPVSQPAVSENSVQEDQMLLRKQTLSPSARKAFGLFRDPFSDDAVQSAEDVYLTPDIRYVREAMFQTARNGGLIAVVSESGGGKTTLLRDLEDRIFRENHPIAIIRPYVLGMEGNDQKGKTLKASHIAEAIMATVAPLEKCKSSPEARFRQLHECLKQSHSAGYRHCLVIDEAHALPIATLKHLKRFFELEQGFKKLLSIILIGQSELKVKLDERNADVREVVQRCEMVELMPLDGQQLGEYLKFKLDRAGKAVNSVIDESGIAALQSRLTLNSQRKESRDTVSLLYPLAVGNLLTAAMNLAADLGSPLVTADVVKGV